MRLWLYGQATTLAVAALLVICCGSTLIGQDLVERFLARHDQPLTEYVGTRRLEARNDRFKMTGWLEACVSLSPARGFSWHVVSEGGSAYIRNKVLRKALDGERDTIARGEPAKAALSMDNYVMREAVSSDAGFGRLDVTPKRQDLLLIHGGVTVTSGDADLVQVDGRLSKMPSFWTRSVQVIRRYARQSGVRVPIEMLSTAEVRIAGRSQFRMLYRYHSINGQAVDFDGLGAAGSCLVTQN